mgnify:CR=1 FL=1
MDPAGLVIVEPVSGAALDAVVPVLARLRIAVFAAYPYLYKGTLTYEEKYLREFARAKDALVVTATTSKSEIVGCATGSAIEDHHADFARPLVEAGIDLPSTFYFGESVLLPDYRGQGIGHRFFDAREAHARDRGYARTCFCAVERPANHPARPVDYSPLDTFWTRRGYAKREDITANFDWPEEPGGAQIAHTMHYWFRDL